MSVLSAFSVCVALMCPQRSEEGTESTGTDLCMALSHHVGAGN